MEKLPFTLALVLVAGLISLLTGRNRRQLEKVPEDMVILCPPPGRRAPAEVRSALWVGILSAGRYGDPHAAGVSGNAGVLGRR